MSKKLKIWTPEVANDESNKNTIYVKLEPDKKDYDIDLIAVDYKGEKIASGNLLTIDQDLDCIILHSNINDDIPLKTDIRECLLAYPVWQLKSSGQTIGMKMPSGLGAMLHEILKRPSSDKDKTEA